MNCPYCNTAAQIRAVRTVVRGDDSPDTHTQVLVVQEMVCRDPHCEHCGEIIGTCEHAIYG